MNISQLLVSESLGLVFTQQVSKLVSRRQTEVAILLTCLSEAQTLSLSPGKMIIILTIRLSVLGEVCLRVRLAEPGSSPASQGEGQPSRLG